MKKGPYFKNQQSNECCGCFYPDCIRLGDDGKGKRLMHCIRHGFHLFTIRRNKLNPNHPPLSLGRLKTEEWRQKELTRLRNSALS